MAELFASEAQTVVPYNAVYPLPTQANSATKITTRIHASRQDYNGGEGTPVQIKFPNDGFINPTNSYLSLLLDTQADKQSYYFAGEVEIEYPVTDGEAARTISAFINDPTKMFNLYTESMDDGTTIAGTASYFNGYFLITQFGWSVVREHKNTGELVTQWEIPFPQNLYPPTGQSVNKYLLPMALIRPLGLQPGGIYETFNRFTYLFGGQKVEDVEQVATLCRVQTVGGITEGYERSTGNILDGMTGASNIVEEDRVHFFATAEEIRYEISQWPLPPFVRSCFMNSSKRRYNPRLFFSGLFSQKKLLPKNFEAATTMIELYLNRMEEAYIMRSSVSGLNPKYSFRQVYFTAEVLKFSEIFNAAFAAALSSENGVMLRCPTWTVSTHNITGQNMLISLADRHKALKGVYCVIRDAGASWDLDYNYFYFNPGLDRTNGTAANSQLEEYQFKVGNQYYPAQPVDCRHGAGESYTELMKQNGSYGDYSFNTNVTAESWCARHFIISQAFERTDLGSELVSGLNTVSANTFELSLKFRSFSQAMLQKRIDVFMMYETFVQHVNNGGINVIK